jgi:erythromycin esterase-like protein
MPTTTDSDLVEAVRVSVHPLGAEPAPYDRLIGMIGDARLVLLGSASHGTHEFYRERGEITKRLIQEKGFRAICVEADWPDASRVDQYVRGTSDDRDAAAALADFRRFPNWMWRNTDVVELVEWLRRHNDGLRPDAGSDEARPKVSFHGLDLYNLQASMEAVLRYLEKVDPKAAMRVRARYACLDSADQASRGYAVLAGGQITQSCKSEALAGLVELQRLAAPGRADRPPEDDTLFDALQNARLVKNAEAFYRSMFLSEESAWNLRERHMAETLETLLQQLDRSGGRSKAVLWAHNSHVGDARGTEMKNHGELSLGQLVRDRHGADAVLVGFTTYRGSVTAARDWEKPAERQWLRPARPGSIEATFHDTDFERLLLIGRDADKLPDGLRRPRLEREIGVIYQADTERGSHYLSARLREQFDAVLHFDETRAVEPLEPSAEWQAGPTPETYPFGV